MLTSKQRASLRGMANTLDTILYIGKEGITDNTVKEAYDALEARREAGLRAPRPRGAGGALRPRARRARAVHRPPVRDVPREPAE